MSHIVHSSLSCSFYLFFHCYLLLEESTHLKSQIILERSTSYPQLEIPLYVKVSYFIYPHRLPSSPMRLETTKQEGDHVPAKQWQSCLKQLLVKIVLTKCKPPPLTVPHPLPEKSSHQVVQIGWNQTPYSKNGKKK